jgi:putative PIN family toxin of toxin-antitoxin system
MIAAVFDCMLFLQAATSDRGPAFACLSLVEAGQVALYVSPPILAEVQDVLMRPKIQAKFPHLTRDRVDLFLQKVATLATLVNEVPDAGFPVRDPDDLPYLNLSIAAHVGYLVSWDKDLRDLMKESSFTATHPQLQIVDPTAFLNTARATKTP